MVYARMVNIVTLMASLGIIENRVYCWSYINWKIFSKSLKRYCYYIIVHLRFSERFDVFLVIQMSFCATLGFKRAL